MIAASWIALEDAITYGLLRSGRVADGAEPPGRPSDNVRRMRIARFTVNDQIAYGVVDGDVADPASLTMNAIDGHPFAPFERTTARLPAGDVRLLPPVLPHKVRRHRQELRRPRA